MLGVYNFLHTALYLLHAFLYFILQNHDEYNLYETSHIHFQGKLIFFLVSYILPNYQTSVMFSSYVALPNQFQSIRECGSTLYVGMAHPAPHTNTNFQITFLLTRLLEALYEDLPVEHLYHHFFGLSFIAEVGFWYTLKQSFLAI